MSRDVDDRVSSSEPLVGIERLEGATMSHDAFLDGPTLGRPARVDLVPREVRCGQGRLARYELVQALPRLRVLVPRAGDGRVEHPHLDTSVSELPRLAEPLTRFGHGTGPQR